MRRFRFPLQGLLRLRGHAERAARRELGASLQRLAQVEQGLQNVGLGLRQCQDQARGTDAAARLAVALETGLRRMEWRLQRERRAAEAGVDRSRTEFLERRRDAQALQRLHDRRREEWRRQVLTAEQAELDELSRLGREARARMEAQA